MSLDLSAVDQPRVSVLMPAYNHAEFIEEAIRSVLSQDYPNLELIVVDDGSTDKTLEVIKRLHTETEGAFLYETKPNGGISSALNAAYLSCSGELIALLASDDFYLDGKIRKQVEAFQRLGPDYGLVHTSAFNQHLDGSRVDITGLYRPAVNDCFREIISLKVVAVAPSVMFTRQAYEDAGGFDEDLPSEDTDFHAAVASKGYKFHYLPEPLLVKRVTGRNLGKNIAANFACHEKTLAKYEDRFSPSEFKAARRDMLISKGRQMAGSDQILQSLKAYMEASQYGGKLGLYKEWTKRAGRSLALRAIPTNARSGLRSWRSQRATKRA